MEKTSKNLLILGEKIAKRRERLQLSQKDLAEMLGITQSSIAQIEKGQTNPSIGRLMTIAKALKCSIEELVSDKVAATLTIDSKANLKNNLEAIKDYLTSEIERIKPNKGADFKAEIPLEILELVAKAGNVPGGYDMIKAFLNGVLSSKK
jgi:transcriptional regulator with XRE-family HTH domain